MQEAQMCMDCSMYLHMYGWESASHIDAFAKSDTKDLVQLASNIDASSKPIASLHDHAATVPIKRRAIGCTCLQNGCSLNPACFDMMVAGRGVDAMPITNTCANHEVLQ